MVKNIFSFDDKSAKKLKNKKNVLGGKGANLGEMGRLGLPVPPGFTITTEVCELFYKSKKNNNWIKIEQIKVKNKLYFSLIILCKNEETITPSAKKDKEKPIKDSL